MFKNFNEFELFASSIDHTQLSDPAALEKVLDGLNTGLFKGGMTESAVLNTGLKITESESFRQLSDDIDTAWKACNAKEISGTLVAKYAESISNRRYPFLILAAKVSQEQATRNSFSDYNTAIELILKMVAETQGINLEDSKTLSEKTLNAPLANLISLHLIPLVHLRGRILIGAYGPELKDLERAQQQTAWLRSLDDACVAALQRPKHISLAIIDRSELHNTAKTAADKDTLMRCYSDLESYVKGYEEVYREDGTIVSWIQDKFNQSVMHHAQGLCANKLAKIGDTDRFNDAHTHFQSMMTLSIEAKNFTRAGWASYWMAANLYDASAAGLTVVDNKPLTIDRIKNALQIAAKYENQSARPTWVTSAITELYAQLPQSPTAYGRHRKEILHGYSQATSPTGSKADYNLVAYSPSHEEKKLSPKTKETAKTFNP